MTRPTCCEITDQAFSEAEARRELRSYRRNGPPSQTRILLDAVRRVTPPGATLLDIGGGIGVIHHELLPESVSAAVHVDASTAYLAEAREEADRRGHTQRVTFIHGDFTEVATDLADADLVTLDRVVCCYPDHHSLLSTAARKARAVLGMTYPREIWYTRIAQRLVNFLERLRGQAFRSYLHPVREIQRLLEDAGLERVSLNQLFLWEVAVYRRAKPVA